MIDKRIKTIQRNGVRLNLRYGLVAVPPFGQVIRSPYTTHNAAMCSGPCAYHRPSKHHMRDWPTVLRLDSGPLLERTCEHGVGHPDPDSLAFLDKSGREGFGIHGCDGCCRRGEEK